MFRSRFSDFGMRTRVTRWRGSGHKDSCAARVLNQAQFRQRIVVSTWPKSDGGGKISPGCPQVFLPRPPLAGEPGPKSKFREAGEAIPFKKSRQPTHHDRVRLKQCTNLLPLFFHCYLWGWSEHSSFKLLPSSSHYPLYKYEYSCRTRHFFSPLFVSAVCVLFYFIYFFAQSVCVQSIRVLKPVNLL